MKRPVIKSQVQEAADGTRKAEVRSNAAVQGPPLPLQRLRCCRPLFPAVAAGAVGRRGRCPCRRLCRRRCCCTCCPRKLQQLQPRPHLALRTARRTASVGRRSELWCPAQQLPLQPLCISPLKPTHPPTHLQQEKLLVPHPHAPHRVRQAEQVPARGGARPAGCVGWASCIS